MLRHPFKGGIIRLVIKVSHGIGVEDHAFRFPRQDLLAIEVKLPLHSLARRFLAFTEIPKVTAKHAALCGGKLFEMLILFGNQRNVGLLPRPHDDTVKGRNVALKVLVCRCEKGMSTCAATEKAGNKCPPLLNVK